MRGDNDGESRSLGVIVVCFLNSFLEFELKIIRERDIVIIVPYLKYFVFD